MADFCGGISNLIALMAICSSIRGVPVVRYLVGDSPNGWSLDVYYESWTSDKNFTVGDTLIFMYDHRYHSVSIVNADDYEKCTSANAIATYNSGITEITLDRPGPFYFISGRRLFCDAGMRFSVNVVAESGGDSSSTTTTSSTSTMLLHRLPIFLHLRPFHQLPTLVQVPNIFLKHLLLK